MPMIPLRSKVGIRLPRRTLPLQASVEAGAALECGILVHYSRLMDLSPRRGPYLSQAPALALQGLPPNLPTHLTRRTGPSLSSHRS